MQTRVRRYLLTGGTVRQTMFRYILLVLAAGLLIGAYAGATADEDSIPAWIKSTAKFWVDGDVDDQTFLNALQFLLSEGVLSIPNAESEQTGAQISTASRATAKISDVGDFYVSYGPNPSSVYTGDDTAEAWLRGTEMLEFEAEFLNEYFRLPYDVEIAAEECGDVNAFYYPDPPRIVLCYELVDDLFETLYYFEQDDYDVDYAAEYAYDVLNYFLYHEIAHALIDIHDLPITGLEENVADQFAVLMLSFTRDEAGDYSPGQDMLYNVATYYFYEDEYWTFHCPGLAEDEEDCYPTYWGQHGLDVQRFYNVACWAYGANPSYNQDLLELGWIADERAPGCIEEYDRINRSWGMLLNKYTNGFF